MGSNANSDEPGGRPLDVTAPLQQTHQVAKRTGPWVMLGLVGAVALTAAAFFALKSAARKPPINFPQPGKVAPSIVRPHLPPPPPDGTLRGGRTK